MLTWCDHPLALPVAVPSSFALAVCRMGWDLVIARPEGYDLPPETMARCRTLAGEAASNVSVTEDRWRLIYQGTDRPLELFDKEADPREQRSVASEQPDVAEALRQKAEAYLLRSDAPWPDETLSVEIDDMELNQLRALGYGIQ